MILLVGLGNPGAEYQFTRHNLGFLVLDAIHEDYGFSSWREKFKGSLSEGLINGHKVLLLKPGTYMNLSGQSVQAVMQFYKIPLENVVVFHDDLDLDPSKVRVKQGGSAGGHKGLLDIDKRLGQNYTRVRLGIGHPRQLGLMQDVSAYVLGLFAKKDLDWIGDLSNRLSHHIPVLLGGERDRYTSLVMDKNHGI
jgi:PTH1 family peptidyl-tRNA hydrolase